MANMNQVQLQAKANYDAAYQALESIKQLRATVSNVFKFLSDSNINEDKSADETPSNQHESAPKSTTRFLQEFQELLSAVNKDFNEVDKNTNFAQSLPDSTLQLPMSWLAMDSTVDKTYRFRDNLQIQQWFKRVNEYSNSTMPFLHKALADRPRANLSAPKNNIRSKRLPIVKNATVSSEIHIKNIFLQITRQPQSHTAEVLHQSGWHRIVKLNIGRVFTAYIVMWSLNIEKVIVKGLDESIYDGDDEFDLETPSQSSLFRKISDLATAAYIQFAVNRAPTQNEYQFLLLVRFLVSYRTLFTTDVCSVCKKSMKDGLPPYFRDFYRTQEMFHESCRAQ